MPIIRWSILTILKFKKEGKKKMSIKIALAGNPNSGKTTLFNGLTGSNQFVGNWPGVTVEKKEGKLKGHKDVIITDLPGIYSLSPYTLEEDVYKRQGYVMAYSTENILSAYSYMLLISTIVPTSLFTYEQRADCGRCV